MDGKSTTTIARCRATRRALCRPVGLALLKPGVAVV